MLKKKYLFIFLIALILGNVSNAHGPSRQKVSESIEINASPDEVWNIVSDFKNFTWNENIQNTVANDNNVGSERLIKFKSGENIKQILEKVDNEKMMINWRIIETNNKILPVNSYSAKLFVKSEQNKTKVFYKTGFYRGFMGNDPPPELNDENSKKLVKNFVLENLKGLKNIIEKN